MVAGNPSMPSDKMEAPVLTRQFTNFRKISNCKAIIETIQDRRIEDRAKFLNLRFPIWSKPVSNQGGEDKEKIVIVQRSKNRAQESFKSRAAGLKGMFDVFGVNSYRCDRVLYKAFVLEYDKILFVGTHFDVAFPIDDAYLDR